LDIIRAFESLENEEMVTVPKEEVDSLETEVIVISSDEEEEIVSFENGQESNASKEALHAPCTSRAVLAERNV
jgi:hypothetical protein